MIPGLKESLQLYWAKGVKVKPLVGPWSSLRIPLCTKGIPDSTGFTWTLLWQRWKCSLLKKIPGRLWNTVGNPYVCRGAHTCKNLLMLQLSVWGVKLSARNEFLVSPSCLEFIFKVICTVLLDHSQKSLHIFTYSKDENIYEHRRKVLRMFNNKQQAKTCYADMII